MTIHTPTSRRFVPGTTGWTEEDLDDPRIGRKWDRGGYEIVEGVLTKMSAAYLEGSFPIRRLVRQIERHLENNGQSGEFGFEVDMVINRTRVPRVDAVFLTAEQLQRQAASQAARRRPARFRYGRLRVAPELVIESLSLGHELHDRQTKREWYRGFAIPNYWMLDPYRQTLECLRLLSGDYVADVIAKEMESVQPMLFAGLTLELSRIWM